MEAVTFSWQNIGTHQDIWNQYFAARKAEFVDRKGWELPHTETAEFDCYDNPLARWIAIVEDGVCLGGSRIIPTDVTTYGGFSYMIRDAQLGVIGGIPKTLIPESLPVAPSVFEATRFFVRPDLPFRKTLAVQKEVVSATCAAAHELGGEQILALMPKKIYVIFRRFGFQVTECEQQDYIDGILHSVGFLQTAPQQQ